VVFDGSEDTIVKGWRCMLCRSDDPVSIPFPAQVDRIEQKVIEHPFIGPTPRIELDVQSRLYRDLVALGYNVRAEVPVMLARFDLVIYDSDDNPVMVIETKHPKTNLGRNDVLAQQLRYMRLTGLPVRVTNSEEDLPVILDMLNS